MTAQNIQNIERAALWHEQWAAKFSEATVRADDPIRKLGYELLRNDHVHLAGTLRAAAADVIPSEPKLPFPPDAKPQ